MARAACEHLRSDSLPGGRWAAQPVARAPHDCVLLPLGCQRFHQLPYFQIAT